jgi:hypothetical protein
MYSKYYKSAGQFFQTVYPPHVGQTNDWGYSPEMHLNEGSNVRYISESSRNQLYAEWRRCA